MVLFEEYVALLLPVHAIFALLTVALSTHLAWWLRHYCRGNFGKRRAIVRFAVLSSGAYVITLLLGMTLYPTYKVRVRAEYLENPSRIHRATEQEAESRKMTRDQDIDVRRYRSAAPEGDAEASKPPAPSAEEVATLGDARVERAARLVRWFDVKEHWAILGFLLSLSACGILLAWKPDKKSAGIARAVTALAVGAAGIAWAAAIIGLMTAGARSVIAL